MSTSNSKLNDLEEEGRKKQEKYQAQIEKRNQKKNNPKVKLIRQAFSTSASLSWFRPGYLLKYFYGIIWLTAIFMSIPYFRSFIKGGPVKVGGGRYGGVSVLDPAKDGYALFWPFVITTALVVIYYAIYLTAKRKIPSMIKKEEDWAASQPFPIENYPAALGENDNETISIQIYYQNKMPDESRMDNIANALQGFDRYYRYNDKLKEEFRFKFKDSGKRSGYKFHTLFHSLMENVLKDIHKEYPLTKIVIER